MRIPGIDVRPEKRNDGERPPNDEGGLSGRIKAECARVWIVHHGYDRNDEQVTTVKNETFCHGRRTFRLEYLASPQLSRAMRIHALIAGWMPQFYLCQDR